MFAKAKSKMWWNAMKLVKQITEARCALLTIKYPSERIIEAMRLLEEEYEGYKEIVWMYADHIMLHGTEDDQAIMTEWVMDCDRKEWDGNQWIAID